MFKRIIAMLLAVLFVIGMAACAKTAETPQPPAADTPKTETPAEETKNEAPAPAEETSEEEPATENAEPTPDADLNYDFTVGYSVLGEATNFFVSVGEGMRAVSAEKGINLLYTIDDRDASKMKTAIDTFVMQGADIIVDFTVLAETGEAIAKTLDIPMLSVDCYYEGAYFFGVNNQAAGETAGAYVEEWVNANWDGQIDAVQMLYNEANGETVKQRVGGAVDHLESAGLLNREIVTETNINSSGSTTTDVSYVRSLVVDYLTAHPEEKHIVIIAQTDEQAMAANAAVEGAGRAGEVAIVSHNCDVNVVAQLQEGKGSIIGTVNYNANGYGEQILRACARILDAKEKGYEVDTYFYNEVYVVNMDNVWNYYPEAVG